MLGVIGGAGVYSIEGLEVIKEQNLVTPFGKPSAPLVFARYDDQDVVFIARHGKKHELLPHEVNYRANIWALKSIGVRQIVGISAVGSLQQEIAPGDFVIPSQYMDFVRGNREKTFFGNGLAAHVSTAEPTCPSLTAAIVQAADRLNMKLHTDKIYACVDGPRLGTKAESDFLRVAAGCDLVGMTNVPEVFLAKEAQICYCAIGVVTDYDCWLETSEEHVTVKDVISSYDESIDNVKILLKEFLSLSLPPIDPEYREVLKNAVITPEDSLTYDKKQLLAILKE
ncbi:MAG: S-methyl-5'-thioadenosine phosphorylase [Alphaproteobacteria bacterium]|nr:S-methyl-5'-thioadenosine phosphorylase [Alphaproteobacteria bacterium]